MPGNKVVGKKARAYIDDLAVYLKSFEMEQSIETHVADATVYADDYESGEIATTSGRFSLQARMDNIYRKPGEATDNLLDRFFYTRIHDDLVAPQVVKSTPAVLTFVPGPSSPIVAGDNAIFTRGWGNLGLAFPRREIEVIRFQLTNTGPIHQGDILVAKSATYDTTVSPTSFNEAILALNGNANGILRASLHIVGFTINSGTPSVVIKIQSDDAVGFPSPVDRLSFAALTQKGSEWKEVTGIASYGAETHHRVVVTVTGISNVTLDYIVVAKPT